MKYQRTRKAVLKAYVLLQKKAPTTLGKVFQKWCREQIKEDYPLFNWALNKDEEKP